MSQNLVRRNFLKQVAAGSAATLAIAASQEPASAEDKYLTSAKLGDFSLYYEVHGSGPAIVFAHGAGGTHMSWWQQVPVLSQKYTCITIDHRTYGYSQDVKGGPGRRAFVGDLAGLLDHLGIPKTALVGQSMGGLTVLGFASAHPDRVTALIMSDTTGGYTSPEIEQIRKAAGNPSASIDRAFAPDYPKSQPAMEFLYREISALTAAAPNAPAKSTSSAPPAASEPTDIAPVLAKKVPVLLIVGAEDQLVAPAIIESFHKSMPGSELVKIPGAGHSGYFEKPDDYNRILLNFLDKHATA
jgi:3-oxoadipate enol-lactonase